MKSTIFFVFFFCCIFAQENQITRLNSGNRLSAPNFYKEIAAPQTSNLLFSIFSAQLALLFLYFGSEGNTAKQLLSALEVQSTEKKALADETKILLKKLASTNLTFDIANGLFVQKNYKIKKTFSEIASQVFEALVQNLDFSKSLEAANKINNWVANKTHKKITNLIDRKSLGPDTRLVLANALYFQGKWKYQFSDSYTKKPEIFYKSATENVETNYMLLEGKFLNYSRCGFLKAHFIRLPIQGGNASMVIILPENRFGLKNIEKHPDALFTPLNMSEKLITLKLPGFLIRSSFALIPALKKLGIVDVFGNNANLSGISEDSLTVTDVLQKTYIKVDKYGIEAAAATAVIIGKTAAISALEITADHPFVFYIEVEGFITFFGKVYDPTREN